MLSSARFDRTSGGVARVAFSPDTRMLAVGSARLVRLIDTASGKELAHIEHDAAVDDMAFSPDSRWLATRTYLNARLIETASGKELARIGDGGDNEDVAYSAERSFLAAWRSIYNIDVRGVAFSPDGRWLITSGRKDGKTTRRLTETATGREVFNLCDGCIPSVAFSADSRLLAASALGPAVVVETASGKLLARIEGEFRDLAISPDGRFLFAAEVGTDGRARLIEIASGKEVARIEHGREIDHVAISPDGRFLAMASKDEPARLIETASGKELARIDGSFVAFSPDNGSMATSSEDGTARLIETATGKELARIQLGPVASVVFSPDIRLLATTTKGNPAV